ncbi:PAS domain-containing protein [Rhizobium sp. CG4]|uniref:PAS domain-containing sensor histidine kinase n=1 Tax=unclassified Rhizobium TaxID=2613769 RepID=UPI002033BDB0|nr:MULTISPECIES: PAS domain-containing protein [unclassified Rhizobium]MCM2458159.1 PAS domain-containing protein [Rhizobium sp. CG4]MCS4243072.1 PAS domain S-box-containing protein [Rhizobium sp. BIGb0125]
MPTPIVLTAFSALTIGFTCGYFWRVWSNRRERKIDKHARAIVEGMPGHGWSNDPEGKFIYVSPPALRYYGLEESFIKMSGHHPDRFHDAYAEMLSEIIHPDDLQGTLDHWGTTLKTGMPATYEYRLRRHDGIYLWHRLAVHPSRDQNGNIIAWYGTQIDIEDQKVAELALRKRERELQVLIDALPVNIWCCDQNGHVTHFSKRLQDFFGCQLDDIPFEDRRVSRANPGLIHPDDAGLAEDLINHSLATGEPLSGRYRMRRNDGTYRWTEQRGELLRDADGNPVQWYGVAIDIDDLKREEDDIRYREQELRLLVDAIPMMIWTVGNEKGITYFNRHLLEFTGIAPDTGHDFRGIEATQAMAALVHLDDLPTLATLYEKSPGHDSVVMMRFRLLRADGVYRWVEGRYAGLTDETGLRQYGFLIDVDDEVRSHDTLRYMEEKLGEASRAASLSELAASIAHEINQPLTAVLSNADACRRWLSRVPPNHERALSSADAMADNAKDAAEIVSSIRALFRRTPRERVVESPNFLIEEVTRIVGLSAVGSRIGIKADLNTELPPVAMDRVQIQQVLVNLIRNALEAVDATSLKATPIMVRSNLHDNKIVIEVIDEGVGLPVGERVTQAFFSTKERGMGMGLAICESIIEAHDGELWHKPNLPNGTVFGFSLPIAKCDHETVQVRPN